MRKFECCDNCKYLYPLHRFVYSENGSGNWEYAHVCVLFPMTYEEKDAFALWIDNPLDSMCEMFFPRRDGET